MKALRATCVLLVAALLTDPIVAQEMVGSTVGSSAVGGVGQRQTDIEVRSDVASTARLDTRIQNRVQSRITSRIGTTYTTQAAPQSPFASAEQQTRAPAPPSR